MYEFLVADPGLPGEGGTQPIILQTYQKLHENEKKMDRGRPLDPPLVTLKAHSHRAKAEEKTKISFDGFSLSFFAFARCELALTYVL